MNRTLTVLVKLRMVGPYPFPMADDWRADRARRPAPRADRRAAVSRPVGRHEERHLRVTGRVDPREPTGRAACGPGPLLLAHHQPSPWLGFELHTVATARYVDERYARRTVHGSGPVTTSA